MSLNFPDQGPSEAGTPGSKADAEGGFPSSRQLKWLSTALMLYFGLRLVFFAVTISPNVPPDEVTHFAVSSIFSKVFFLPVDSAESYQYGLVTTIPWLYYWIMGKLLHLNFLGIPDLVFLRLLNIPLAFGTVYFSLRTLRLLASERLPQVLLIVALTNTIMFSFLSASVSYDNLTNLLAAMAMYYLFTFFKERSGSMLAASFLCQLAGCLTKITFLPLVLMLNVLLLINEFGNLRALPSYMKLWLRSSGGRGLCLVAGIVLGLALNMQLYGGNYLNYKSLAPDMADVLSPEIAMQYRTQARNMIFTLFKEGKVSKEKALEMASGISNKADRDCTVVLIEDYDYLKSSGEPVIGPFAYIPIWADIMFAGTFSIFAQLPMPISGFRILLFVALLFLAALGFLIRWRPRHDGRLPAYLLAVAAFYAVFLMYVVNYRTYLDYRATWLSLQGRYIFPVIGPIYVLCSIYLLRFFEERSVRLGIFFMAAFIFLASDFPHFISSVTPAWFGGWPRG